ncbi:MAG: 16S rRNA (guanine(527)-N(7))-methyltransferase RsmG [Gammaproteobacteria bacterium]|nr:16S rRNA (guanine(527)-N(7))-methyltransferase RsmG [Gammaproteobacteria bacterium]NND37976.1 16S rRNA (guanine(527)-N(7))-methyltransferase RsmG [Pseudomonadales bacterium]NNM11220.1 16S rRNA (guanine(527)-N(7))-methyltransferase RsmG [Pseudomonadales bacterium]RZV51702.1 MAG: 16S rRNA (guanine(527)-N(7))-methyltransferase RsmG [Pseudomonadales bacterium]
MKEALTPAVLLKQGATSLGLSVSDDESEQLLTYLSLLARFNRKHNLTAVRNESAMVATHLLDSLSILPYLPPGRLLDVGSGAGLPGIPVALLQPQRRCLLLDASFKRVVFLQDVARRLSLNNVAVVHSRVEDFQSEPFDVCTTRAFATLDKTLALSEHLLGDTGVWLAMKGRYPGDELHELAQKTADRYLVQCVEPLQVPGLDAERHAVLIGKQIDPGA